MIRDDHEDSLDLPAGDAELLLMITDRSFGADGEPLYPALDPSLTRQPGVEDDYMDGVLGDVMLVNGAPSPRTRVAATRYRLRMVNGCNARPLRFPAYRGRYMLHCHNLEHEDMAMMANIDVI